MIWLLLILTSHPLIENSTGRITSHASRNGFLDIVAQEHAEDMARRGEQDHDGFEFRYKEIQKVIDCKEVSEICNESWPDQNQQEAAKQAWKDWEKSKSHWRTANGFLRNGRLVIPKFYGVGMTLGKNGIWYSTIIATWCG